LFLPGIIIICSSIVFGVLFKHDIHKSPNSWILIFGFLVVVCHLTSILNYKKSFYSTRHKFISSILLILFLSCWTISIFISEDIATTLEVLLFTAYFIGITLIHLEILEQNNKEISERILYCSIGFGLISSISFLIIQWIFDNNNHWLSILEIFIDVSVVPIFLVEINNQIIEYELTLNK